MEELIKRLKDLEDIKEIQVSEPSSHPTPKQDPYMFGLANGLILACATMKGESPNFLNRYRPHNESLINEFDWKKAIAAGMIGMTAAASPMMTGSAEAKPLAVHQTLEPNIVAQVLAGEGANQGRRGMHAIANVIQNRMKNGKHAEDIVTKPKQFSAYADKNLMARNYKQVKSDADDIASKIGSLEDITGGATHYVTKELYNKKKDNPRHWVSKLKVTKIIGDHVFMR